MLVDLLDVWAQLGVDVMGRMTPACIGAASYQAKTAREEGMMSEQSSHPSSLSGKISVAGRTTSADVARLAGVSQSAVSRVFTMARQHQQRHLQRSKRSRRTAGLSAEQAGPVPAYR